MPMITVTSTVTTVYEVPEGVSIERVRHLSLPVLGEEEEQTDSVVCLHDRAINSTYLGDAQSVRMSVEHRIIEGTA